jgi:hypothetical protein
MDTHRQAIEAAGLRVAATRENLYEFKRARHASATTG